MRIDELDVERINVVSADGRTRLVITCAERLPDPVVNGQELRRQGGGAGLVFYNADGDECGGLVFDGRRSGDGYSAGGGLLFDQFLQDQVVGLLYDDESGRRSYGLRLWERPTLRPCLEDELGAGAIITATGLPPSPEAALARHAFAALRSSLADALWECASGRELRAIGFGDDVRFMARLDALAVVPGRDLDGWIRRRGD